jgi:ribosomal protein S11
MHACQLMRRLLPRPAGCPSLWAALQRHLCSQDAPVVAPAVPQPDPGTGADDLPSSSGSGEQQRPDRPSPRGGALFGPRLVQGLQRGAAKAAPQQGIIHIHNSSNNCIMVLTDREGKVKTWTSGGTVGYKNAGKATPQAAEAAAAELARRALDKGFSSAIVKLKGAGRNKQFAVQALAAHGVQITQLQEVTSIPYNGCRLPRKRRT